LNERLRAICLAENVLCFDANKYVSGCLHNDRLHLNGAGGRLSAKSLSAFCIKCCSVVLSENSTAIQSTLPT
jgi:hypothetical protein